MAKSWLGIDEDEKILNGMMFGGMKENTNNTGFVIVFLNKKHHYQYLKLRKKRIICRMHNRFFVGVF